MTGASFCGVAAASVGASVNANALVLATGTEIVRKIGIFSVPIILLFAGLVMLISKKNPTGAFISGARSGFSTCIRLLPSLVLLIVGVYMFSASGALDIICTLLNPLARILHIPSEIIPVVVMRPISGSAATAMMQKLLTDVSPDSFAGRCASIIMGSSDTIIYTLAMYFGSAGIKKSRYAMPASITVLMFCVAVSVMLAGLSA